jgi:D-alanine transfer protein
MSAPRLVAAVAAVLLVGAGLVAGASHARRLEIHAVHAVAPQMFAQKNRGLALQRAALHQPDLLPLFGSSELNVANPFHPSALFREYPTGFTVFPVGDLGSTSLVWLQAVAALGPELRGRKVAVSIPARAFMIERTDRHAYAANFSRLHANELAFSIRLPFALKQAAARRMLEFPETLRGDRLLAFALECLGDGSPFSRLVYYACVPLGQLHNLVLRLQDHTETIVFLRAQRGLSRPARHSADLDWPALRERAEAQARRRADNNPLGFENGVWTAHAGEIDMQRRARGEDGVASPPRPDEGSAVARSDEWADFTLLLQVIRSLGGAPLILSAPLHGAYYDYIGVPLSIRQAVYGRLRELASAEGVPLVDFAKHDSDPYFTIDSGFHLSGKGWVHYGQAVDAFFHGVQPADS